MDAPSPHLAVGLALSDPLGVAVRYEPRPHLELHGVAGLRLLCPDGEPCGFPGPLLAVDAVGFVGRVVGAHAGVGLGGGWVTEGCWFDAVAEFCVDGTAPSVLARAPIGLDLRVGRFEATAEAVPAFRFAPDPHLTFLGGLQLRWRVF